MRNIFRNVIVLTTVGNVILLLGLILIGCGDGDSGQPSVQEAPVAIKQLAPTVDDDDGSAEHGITVNHDQFVHARSHTFLGAPPISAVSLPLETGIMTNRTVSQSQMLSISCSEDKDCPTGTQCNTTLKTCTCPPFNGDPYPLKYSGTQVDTRRSFSYGMFVMRAWPNADTEKQKTVTGFFIQSFQPPTGYYPELSRLWRWTELDFEFVPFNTSPQREQVECVGTFPNAQCTEYHANGGYWTLGESKQFIPLTKVQGAYSNNIIATQVAKLGSPNPDPAKPNIDQSAKIKNWNDLVKDTGTVFDWPFSDKWGFPPSLQQPDPTDPQNAIKWRYPAPDSTLNPVCPTESQLRHSVALNYFRMGDLNGQRRVSALGVDAPFLPLSTTPPPSGFAMCNEQYLWATDDKGTFTFDPLSGYYTYTIVWTQHQVLFFIDAPNNGTDISNATPVKVFTSADYPDIVMTGRNYPGGNLEWAYYGNQHHKMGDMMIMFNIWANTGWGGILLGNFQQSTSYVQHVAYYPLADPNNTGQGKLGTKDFVLDPNNPNVFLVDFTTTSWTADTWRDLFQQNFVTEFETHCYNEDLSIRLTKNPELVTWVEKDPTGQKSLQLKLVPIEKTPPRTFYLLSPGGNPGDPSTWTMGTVEVNGKIIAAMSAPSVGGSNPFWVKPKTQATVTSTFINDSAKKPRKCLIEFLGIDGKNDSFKVVDPQPAGNDCSFIGLGNNLKNGTITS